MATNNSINIPIPASVGNGGTGATTFTAGGILYGNTTSAIGVTAAGSSGQALTSNGASAPTFQAYTANNGYVLIQSQTASNSASLAFTSSITNTYANYLAVLTNIVPASSANALFIQVSTNAGVSYVTTGYQSGIISNPLNATTLSNSNSTAHFVCDHADVTNSVGMSGYVYFWGLSTASNLIISGQTLYNNGSTYVSARLGGTVTSNTNNGIKFLFNSGNITSGTITLFGIQQT